MVLCLCKCAASEHTVNLDQVTRVSLYGAVSLNGTTALTNAEIFSSHIFLMSIVCLSRRDNQTLQACSAYGSLHIARSKASNCLLQTNPQSLNSVIIPSKLPGVTYNADEQCQILFGPTASFCQEMQVRMGDYFRKHTYRLLFLRHVLLCMCLRECSTIEMGSLRVDFWIRYERFPLFVL